MFLFWILLSCFLINSCLCPYVFDSSCKDGFHFGHPPNSYISYTFQRYQETLKVSFDMKTLHKDGLVFYAHGFLSKSDHYALFYINGYLHVSYCCDDYTRRYETDVDSGKWYTLKFTSNETSTEIQIFDETSKKRIYNNTIAKGCPHLKLAPLYYFGSVDRDHQDEMAKLGLNNDTGHFVGCMRNIVVNSRSPESPIEKRSEVVPCVQQEKEGNITFIGKGDYLLVDEHFVIEDMLFLRMEIKPKTNDGTLLFHKSKNNSNSLILELENCCLRLTVTHETTYFNFSSKLCDGKWHYIGVTKNVSGYIVNVDSGTVGRKYPKYYNPDGRGSGPLYLGGGPTNPAIGQQYIGGVNNFKIHGEKYDIFTYNSWGDLAVDQCPPR